MGRKSKWTCGECWTTLDENDVNYSLFEEDGGTRYCHSQSWDFVTCWIKRCVEDAPEWQELLDEYYDEDGRPHWCQDCADLDEGQCCDRCASLMGDCGTEE